MITYLSGTDDDSNIVNYVETNYAYYIKGSFNVIVDYDNNHLYDTDFSLGPVTRLAEPEYKEENPTVYIYFEGIQEHCDLQYSSTLKDHTMTSEDIDYTLDVYKHQIWLTFGSKDYPSLIIENVHYTRINARGDIYVYPNRVKNKTFL